MGTEDSKGRRRRRRIVVSAALLVVGVAALYFGVLRDQDQSKAPRIAPPTEVVRRGDIRATVAGVGTLAPKRSVNLGFGASGQVTSVDVRLGQKVRAGQVLARLDDRLPRANLAAARSQAAAAEAKVGELIEAHTPQERNKVLAEEAAAAKLARSTGRSVDEARQVATGEVATLRSAVRRAKETDQVASRRFATSRSKLDSKRAVAASAEADVKNAKAAVSAAREAAVAIAGKKEAARAKAEEEEAKERQRNEEEEARERKRSEEEEKKEREAAEAEGKEFTPRESRIRDRTVIARNPEAGIASAEAGAQATLDAAQALLAAKESKLQRARGEVEAARTSLPELRELARTSAQMVATAKTELRSGQATAKQTVQSAREADETSKAAILTTRATGEAELQPTRTGELAEAEADVSQAESNVRAGEKAVAETALRAPAAGRISSLKLAAGDVVGSGGQASQAGGATSGAGEAEETSSKFFTGSGEGEAGGGAEGSGSPIVLTSPNLRLFSVLLTEGDAVQVHAGDKASVMIDALRRTVKGRLVNVLPLPTMKSGVVDYTATVAAAGLPKQLRIGMAAEVTVVIANHHGVPILSRTALPATAGTVDVKVLKSGSTRPESRTVRLGLASEEDVEVKDGLRPGDRVVLPQEAEGAPEEEEEE